MKAKPTFPQEDFSMPAWLYQLTAGDYANGPWYPAQYRQEVQENKSLVWPAGERVYSREQGGINVGDIVIFFFCKTQRDGTRNGEPGIYGWGTITDVTYYSSHTGKYIADQITFVANPPSDYLKTHVLWDREIDQVMNEIRGGQWRGTMWDVTASQLQKLREKIHQHIDR
jgi:hypothetical protein